MKPSPNVPTENAPSATALRDRLARHRQPLPAANRVLFLVRERLPAPFLAQRTAGTESKVEIVEDLGALIVGHGTSV